MKLRQTKIINRHLLISRAIEMGLNSFLPVYDDGIDLILHGGEPERTYFVQLKSRWTIEKKYITRNPHIAFPFREIWFLVPHNELVGFAKENTNYLNTVSWISNGVYNTGSPSKEILKHLEKYQF